MAKVNVKFKGSEIIELNGLQNSAKIENPYLWWPRGMGEPNLYEAEAN